MKKQKEFTSDDVKSYALKLMTSKMAISCGKVPRLDKRFSFNQAVLAYMRKNPVNRVEVLAKMKARSKNNPAPYTNVLSRPLVKDFKSNRHELRQILPDRLVFISGRNHWAKDGLDRKILSILKK